MGNPTGSVKVSAFVTNNGHNDLSNQFFTVPVPEPGSMAIWWG